ncbi:methyl-accepting chemotaxis protein [Vibrio parahaemolyticus]|uniref:methyl-accepting chemotaxis protein n=1 Tax=Vibrio parahaemolyticus TaxID=670 RepID=UPI00215C85A9|nr:methyl-accepting chemotaxis protein [Vibrio parahaemolyticus]MCR9713269.1 methyl-accepting chemotaxis protein [Vibrio parahaemolyticus]
MSIKQSIAALVILLSVSFSAFAVDDYDQNKLYRVIDFRSDFGQVIGNCGLMVGDIARVTACLSATWNCGKDQPCNANQAYVKDKRILAVRDASQGRYAYVANVEVFEGCATGEIYNPETRQCEASKNHCEKLMETEPTLGVWWNEEAYGRDMLGNFWCGSASNCTAQLTTFVGCDSGKCFADAHYTGDECQHGTLNGFCTDSSCSAELPEPEKPDPDNPDPDNPDPDNPDPDNPDPDNPDVDDPTHKPDDPTGGDIEDPSVLPDSDSDIVVPKPPTDEPDVEDPPTDESTDTAVVNAITGMNKDVNKALNDMNIDINQASADVQNQIIALNASVVTNTQAIQKQQANDNEIYRKTKALIQQANADVTTAVNQNTNAINGVGDDVEKIAGAMDGIAEDVAGISDTLDGIANTDTSGAGIGGTCIETGTCTGFYESKYPEGLGGLVSGQLNDLKVNTIDNFVSSFGNLDLSNAQRPSFVLPVPFFGDFSFEEHISFDWVFGFVRAVLIMTSIFAARRIIFGG